MDNEVLLIIIYIHIQFDLQRENAPQYSDMAKHF